MECVEYWRLLSDDSSVEDLTEAAREWQTHDQACDVCRAASRRCREDRLKQGGARVHCAIVVAHILASADH